MENGKKVPGWEKKNLTIMACCFFEYKPLNQILEMRSLGRLLQAIADELELWITGNSNSIDPPLSTFFPVQDDHLFLFLATTSVNTNPS
jgi:hypothetical protein